MFYLLDKPKGISSYKAIREFAKEKKIKKIGHTGTLDPLATGALLVATDADTKLIEYVDKGFKTYVATMEIGKISDTYDSEGIVQKISDCNVTEQKIIETLHSFEGEQFQTPPSFSAKKINGKKAYELARKGEVVELKKIKVNIKDIKIISIEEKTVFEVTVSRGTYIRSLIHDFGQKIKCGAIMTELRRTKIGSLTEHDFNKEANIKDLLTLDVIEMKNIDDLKHGKTIQTKLSDGKYVINYENDIVGIVNVENEIMKVEKLLGNKL